MNRDGTNQTPLTSSDGTSTVPNWSPDSTKIAFYSGRSGQPQTYIMDQDGTNETRLTFEIPKISDNPIWSPNGQKITFDTTRNNIVEMFIMDADGQNQQVLITPARVVPARAQFQPVSVNTTTEISSTTIITQVFVVIMIIGMAVVQRREE